MWFHLAGLGKHTENKCPEHCCWVWVTYTCDTLTIYLHLISSNQMESYSLPSAWALAFPVPNQPALYTNQYDLWKARQASHFPVVPPVQPNCTWVQTKAFTLLCGALHVQELPTASIILHNVPPSLPPQHTHCMPECLSWLSLSP